MVLGKNSSYQLGVHTAEPEVPHPVRWFGDVEQSGAMARAHAYAAWMAVFGVGGSHRLLAVQAPLFRVADLLDQSRGRNERLARHATEVQASPPPIRLCSISATRPPSPAVPAAVTSQAVPAPITTTL